jgi:putative endonuclease
MNTYFVYIMSSRSRVLYTGVTNDLPRRIHEHRQQRTFSFTSRHRVHRLVYLEPTASPASAISREKVIKGWTRRKKIELIEGVNPGWEDLSERWGGV